MKKRLVVYVAAFLFAITASFAFTPATHHAISKSDFSTQTVFYNTGTQTNCPNSITCSNVNNNDVLCVSGISTYYDSRATPCTATSAFKWKP